MSDLPWQLPISDGTGDPFSKVTRQPPKFTLRGVGADTPEGRAAWEKWQGAVRQFYQQQAQDRSLTVTNFQSVTADLDDGVRVTYTRNFELETVELEVNASSSTSEEKSEKVDGWDWALVELTINNIKQTRPVFAAFLVKPPVAVLSGSLPEKGVVKDDGLWSPASDAPGQLLAYANDPNAPVTGTPIVGEAKQVSSLRVDLRKFKTGGPIKVELWGWMRPYTQTGLPTDPQAQYTITGTDVLQRQRIYRYDNTRYAINCTTDEFAAFQTAFPEFAGNTILDTSSTYTDIAGDEERSGGTFALNGLFGQGPFYNVAWEFSGGSWSTWPLGTGGGATDYPGWSALKVTTGAPMAVSDPNSWTSTFANVAYNTETITYWPGTTYKRIDAFSGVKWHAPGGANVNGNVVVAGAAGQYSISAMDYQFLGIPLCTVYPQFKADLTFVMIKGGDPWDVCSEHYYASTSDNFPAYFQWEDSKKYPDRFHMGKGPDQILIPSFDAPGDTSLANHFGLKLLGTLVIDAKHGNVGFKPA